MDQNLFAGLDRDLYTVREERSHEIFSKIYRATVKRVFSVAKFFAPRHNFFSMSTRSDYVQQAYLGVWSKLPSYNWVCRVCDLKFTTSWGFEIHGCQESKPKHRISEYANFVLWRAMKHYQRFHISSCRDERMCVGNNDFGFPNGWGQRDSYKYEYPYSSPPDVSDLLERKSALETVRDLVCLEADPVVKFFVEGCLDQQTTSEIYDTGLDVGLWADRRDAYRWLERAKGRGAFDPYQRALTE